MQFTSRLGQVLLIPEVESFDQNVGQVWSVVNRVCI